MIKYDKVYELYSYVYSDIIVLILNQIHKGLYPNMYSLSLLTPKYLQPLIKNIDFQWIRSLKGMVKGQTELVALLH